MWNPFLLSRLSARAGGQFRKEGFVGKMKVLVGHTGAVFARSTSRS